MSSRELPRIGFVLGLLIMGGPALPASQQDFNQCTQTNEIAGSIAACTSIIEDQRVDASARLNAYLWRAGSYSTPGNLDDAVADYGKAIEFDPKNVTAYVSRVIAYLGKGDHANAIADYRKAKMFDPAQVAQMAAASGDLKEIASVSAQSYPAHTVQVIVPFSPGGAIDFVASAIVTRIYQEFQIPFVVVNKPATMAQVLSNAAPDGYTLVLGPLGQLPASTSGLAGNVLQVAMIGRLRETKNSRTTSEYMLGVAAPAGTPADIVQTLNSAFGQALGSAEVRARLAPSTNMSLELGQATDTL